MEAVAIPGCKQWVAPGHVESCQESLNSDARSHHGMRAGRTSRDFALDQEALNPRVLSANCEALTSTFETYNLFLSTFSK